jgi:hypothetical protein
LSWLKPNPPSRLRTASGGLSGINPARWSKADS